MREYRYAEKCLYSYKGNEELLSDVRAELSELRQRGDIHGYMYDVPSKSSRGHTDPVSSYVSALESAERRVMRLMRRVVPVRRLRKDVKGGGRRNAHHRLILEEYYIEHVPMTTLLASVHWSRSAFFARRYDLVLRAISYLMQQD